MEIKGQLIEVNYYPLDITLDTGEATPENPGTNMPSTPASMDNIIRAAGGSVLIDGVLQSSNFVKGIAGWIIRASGTVELGDGIFRGTITATAGFIGGFTIGATTIYSTGNEIVLDSANKRIEVGASDEIVIDGDNKKITVGASDEITIDGANKKIESSNYVAGYAGAGFHLSSDLLEVGNIVARGLLRSAVFQKDIINVMGGNFMVLDGDMLDADMTALDASTLTIKGTTTFSVGDFLRIKDGTDDEWLEVTNVGSAPVYTVTRDKAGDYGANANPVWKKGVAVANYKQSGDGGLYMTASETNAPYLSIFTHAGAPWTTISERLRIGNLNGIGGFSADVYGAFIGNKTTGNYLSYDDGSGELVVGAAKIIKGYTAGIALTAGQAVLIHTDGKVYPTNAVIVNVVNQFLGFCLEDTAVAGFAPIQIFGDITGLSGKTTASVYYISNGTHTTDQSQTNSDTGNTALDHTGYTNWQSFKPGGNNISQVSINVSNASGAGRTYDVRVYSGEGIGTSLGEATSAAIPTGGAANDVVAIFDVPIAVTAGNTYTFACKASGDNCDWSEEQGSDDYADGRNNNNSAYDYYFITSKINSYGAIGTGAGTNSKKVGIAASATTLALKDSI